MAIHKRIVVNLIAGELIVEVDGLNRGRAEKHCARKQDGSSKEGECIIANLGMLDALNMLQNTNLVLPCECLETC